MKKNTKRSGFTTVELVIVIAIIAILSTVLIPTFSNLITKANDSKVLQEARNAYTEYLLENNGSAPEIMLYSDGERWIALHKGKPGNVYANREDALKEVVDNPDVAKMIDIGDGKLWVYGSGAVNVSDPYAGKVISILGDSISTLEGYIPVDDGFNLKHRPRYVLNAKPDTSLIVMPANETWWMRIINDLDAKLGINDSWAGSCVTYNSSFTTKYPTNGDLVEKAAMASLTRIQNLGANGTPDVILFYGGTNDIGHGGNTLNLGSFNPAQAPTTVDLEATAWNTIADAYVAAILRIKHYYPNAEIIAMLPTYTSGYYTNNKLAQYNAVFTQICEHYGITYVDLRESGISTSDLVDGIHPNSTGMAYIAEAVKGALKNIPAAGENVVHSVTYNLTNAESSLGYYKGVSNGKRFTTTITGTDLAVTVTMGGVDITNTAYNNGIIDIAKVTGDIVITASSASPWGAHLQARPDGATSATNLWTALTPEGMYYGLDGWGNGGNQTTIYSITVPVQAGELIYASAFGSSKTNGGTANGIRVTFLLANGEIDSKSPATIYQEFSSKGYITVPHDAVAVCIPMWVNNDAQEVFIGGNVVKNRELFAHLQQLPKTFTSTTNLWDELTIESIYYHPMNGWNNAGVVSVTIPVMAGMKLDANSFKKAGENGISNQNGIRVTFFLDNGEVISYLPEETFTLYTQNDGCLVAPDDVAAVNVVWRNANSGNYLYIIDSN